MKVQIKDVPVQGIIDTGSDITILSGPDFQETVTKTTLKSKTLSLLIGKSAGRKACTYGQQPLHLDGQMN